MEVVEYPDRDLLMMRLADQITSDLNESLMTHDQATLCVPGGTTPAPLFDILTSVDLDWSRVYVLLNDERWVPETSDRSNTRLLRERLLIGRAAPANLVPLFRDAPQPEDVIDDLIVGVEGALPISVLLLGMGADMHTASLFPGADRLADALDHDAPPLMAMRAPGAPEPRITLTAPVLSGALKTHILITGGEKRAALDVAAHRGPVAEAPVRAVLPNATVHWAA